MKKKVLFIGSKQIGLQTLKCMHSISPDSLIGIVTYNDSSDTRTKLSDFKLYSQENNIDLFVLNKPSELKRVIEELLPDICIVVGWYWIIKNNLLKIVPGGFLGVHASLLPKYRGGAPLVWSIINGEKESGVTLFYFDEGMDSGDILAQKKFSIGDEDTIKEILSKAEELTIDLIKENYLLILDGNASKIKQNNSNASYCSQRKPEDGKIIWNQSNQDIYNFIRAQTNPYPGAFCFGSDHKKLYILSAKVYPNDYYGIPGLIVQCLKDHVIITCGKGAIEIYEVKYEGLEKEPVTNVLKYGMKLE
jgi:methionyl-tRNA formyltransferase